MTKTCKCKPNPIFTLRFFKDSRRPTSYWRKNNNTTMLAGILSVYLLSVKMKINDWIDAKSWNVAWRHSATRDLFIYINRTRYAIFCYTNYLITTTGKVLFIVGIPPPPKVVHAWIPTHPHYTQTSPSLTHCLHIKHPVYSLSFQPLAYLYCTP